MGTQTIKYNIRKAAERDKEFEKCMIRPEKAAESPADKRARLQREKLGNALAADRMVRCLDDKTVGKFQESYVRMAGNGRVAIGNAACSSLSLSLSLSSVCSSSPHQARSTHDNHVQATRRGPAG